MVVCCCNYCRSKSIARSEGTRWHWRNSKETKREQTRVGRNEPWVCFFGRFVYMTVTAKGWWVSELCSPSFSLSTSKASIFSIEEVRKKNACCPCTPHTRRGQGTLTTTELVSTHGKIIHLWALTRLFNLFWWLFLCSLHYTFCRTQRTVLRI